MNLKFIFAFFFLLAFNISLYSQDKLFFNRIHYFEHQECQHPIGTVIEDKVFFANNNDNTYYLNFNNTKYNMALVDLIKYGEYTSFNQYPKDNLLAANKISIGFRIDVPNKSKSMEEARSRFRLDKVTDSIIDGKTLKHIRIVPKEPQVYQFESYHVLINTDTTTEKPLFTSPTVYFLLLGNLEDLKGTVVETYFIDLEGYRFCRDVLKGLQIINKRLITD